MNIFIPKESIAEETRIALLPAEVKRFVQLGAELTVESGIGASVNIPDSAYEDRGGNISTNRQDSLSTADVVMSINLLPSDDLRSLKGGCILISHLNPFHQAEIIRDLAAKNISAISLDMIPRTTIAQKMDVLSSQDNLAGYVAVLIAAERMQKIFPMMMTPAGTISPARVFVIGAGVAGLQAIATAKRLGARVDAFDVRPEAQEQIVSLGAKPLKVEAAQAESTQDGYAKQLTEEQLDLQRKAMAKQCAQSDVVITTAKVFGKKAPLIVTNEMLDSMKEGSMVVDLAVETGGNVECSEPEEEIKHNNVTVIGLTKLQRRVPLSASGMFSSNLFNFVEHFWDNEAGQMVLDRNDEIIQGCLMTYDGQILNEAAKQNLE
jgi:NAD(P) transhydrogenase subunit alpha